MLDTGMFDVYSMFSVPLFKYRIRNWYKNKQELYDLIPKWDDGIRDGKVYTDYHNKRGYKPPYADKVLDLIHPFFINFTKDIENKKVGLNDMWCQTSYRGQKHNLHNHGYFGWSAVLYVEFDPQVHSATSFISPFNNPHDGNINYHVPNVEEGDLIVFPSTIAHESLENESDKPRTIISFNFTTFHNTVRMIIDCC